MKVHANFKKKLEHLNHGRTAEDTEEEEVDRDPLFMNIDQIEKLPMASKKPTKILAIDTLSTVASTNQSETNDN